MGVPPMRVRTRTGRGASREAVAKRLFIYANEEPLRRGRLLPSPGVGPSDVAADRVALKGR